MLMALFCSIVLPLPVHFVVQLFLIRSLLLSKAGNTLEAKASQGGARQSHLTLCRQRSEPRYMLQTASTKAAIGR